MDRSYKNWNVKLEYVTRSGIFHLVLKYQVVWVLLFASREMNLLGYLEHVMIVLHLVDVVDVVDVSYVVSVHVGMGMGLNFIYFESLVRWSHVCTIQFVCVNIHVKGMDLFWFITLFVRFFMSWLWIYIKWHEITSKPPHQNLLWLFSLRVMLNCTTLLY